MSGPHSRAYQDGSTDARRMADALASTAVPVLLLGDDGSLEWANAAFARLLDR